MDKKILYVVGGCIALGIIGYGYVSSIRNVAPAVSVVRDYKNAEYIIDGKAIKLTAGVSEIESTLGSATKIVTRYFGNELKKDLDGDGREDVTFLLTQERGGSGTFFYVVSARNTEAGYVGSHGLLLGDRIAPQTTESGKGKMVVVNYADRAVGDSFTTRPSVGKSIWLLLDPSTMQFGEVVQDFEGEADPKKMSLGMKTWNFVSALYNGGTHIIPKKAGQFSLTFSKDGAFSATTDCNSMGGRYTATGSTIAFDQMISTQMYCEGSQESDFVQLLQKAGGYFFTSSGELILDLKFDSGSATFR